MFGASLSGPWRSDLRRHRDRCGIACVSAVRSAESLGGQYSVDAFLFQHDDEEFCWLRRARIASDRVHIVRALVESLSGRKSDLLAASNLFDDRPFQHVDEGIRIVPMDVLHSSGRIVDGKHHHLVAGDVCEILLHDGDHDRLRWCGLRIRREL
jgi:hypothetical protein